MPAAEIVACASNARSSTLPEAKRLRRSAAIPAGRSRVFASDVQAGQWLMRQQIGASSSRWRVTLPNIISRMREWP